MEGGIQEWQGLTAEGPPEGGIAYFAAGTDAADMAALAWALEENTRLFYTSLAGMRPDTEEAALFLKLVNAEDSKSSGRKPLRVRVSPPVPIKFKGLAANG